MSLPTPNLPVLGAIQTRPCLLACAHLPTLRPQPLRTPDLRKTKTVRISPGTHGRGEPEGGPKVGAPGAGGKGGGTSWAEGRGHARPGGGTTCGKVWLQGENLSIRNCQGVTGANQRVGAGGRSGDPEDGQGVGVLGAPRVGTGGGCTFSSSSTTSMCTSPRTDSPLMWVMRSPARRPASWAGLPSSTFWG